jgi:hypothetical protein
MTMHEVFGLEDARRVDAAGAARGAGRGAVPDRKLSPREPANPTIAQYVAQCSMNVFATGAKPASDRIAR